MALNIGIVGATGMVGEVFLSLLHKRQFPVKELRLFASEASKGKTITFNDQPIELKVLTEGCFDGLDLVFFSSGDEISREWAPQAQAAGAFAVDNSAAFRMSSEHPLVVPEINGDLLPDKNSPTIIANPNCSTIQLVVALKPLADAFGLKDVRVATYQAVSGGGKPAQQELVSQMQTMATGQEPPAPQAFPHTIASNCLPQIGSFDDQGYCSEEAKIMRETRKILGLPDLKISAFTVRVPVMNGHSEAVWVTLDREASESEVMAALESQPGLVVVPQTQGENYPHAQSASGQDSVYVGRIHRDLDDPHTWLMWVVADNILKGAALNGLQIAERLFEA